MSIAHTTLFRRTLAVLGSAAAMLAAAPSLGQGTATMVGGTTSCPYTTMTVAPNGNITINCGAANDTTATFILTAPASLTVGGAVGNALVSRSGGPNVSLTVNYSASGACSTTGTGALTFALVGGTQSIPLTPAAAAGTCIVSITPPATHAVSPSSGSVSIPVTTGGGGGPEPIPGCPAPQADYKLVNLGWSSAPSELRMATGVIASFPIPAPRTTKSSVRLSQGQVAVSPGGISEFSISKCPGVINTSGGSCYKSVPAGNYTNAPDAYTKPVGTWDSQAEFDSRLSCWAPAAEGQWYVNVRWTYTTTNCPYGCGYSLQWYEGSY
jgi:hypothetical protein